MWNIDGRNKNATTLFSPEFCSSPDEQYQQPKPLGQRLRRALFYKLGLGSIWLRREKTAQQIDRQPQSYRDRSD
jgi:hypothetical protein